MEAENEFTTSSPDGGSTTQEISYGLVGFFIFVGVLVVLFIVKKKCVHEKHTESHSEKDYSFSSECEDELSDVFIDKLTCKDAKTFRDSPYCGKLDEDLKVLIDEHRIDARRLSIEHTIGKGQFGCVYEATLAKDVRSSNDYGSLTHEKVAVKTIRGESCNMDSIEAFLREGMIMREFRHENVLTLIGVALGSNGLPMIILPHMLNGNLKAYIAKPTLQVTVRELLQFGEQVARGMQYLSQHKFVHRDLATRNCMLDEHFTVKVADFGLSRDIYMKEYYSSSDRQAMLPVKWMALESLVHSVYTTKSDVWSFGVLLWELLTRGTTPYPDVSNWDIRQYVQSGRRLHQPESCPDDLYVLMRKCWSAEPSDRPSFADIVRQLEEILGGEDDDENEEDTPSMEHNYANLDASVDVYITQGSPPVSPNSGHRSPHLGSDSFSDSATGEELQSHGNGFATTVEHADVH